jgi:hypothetical protein
MRERKEEGGLEANKKVTEREEGRGRLEVEKEVTEREEGRGRTAGRQGSN